MNLTHDNPDCLWINPDLFDDGDGTFEHPYCAIETGLERVQPGQAVVLQAGNYGADCNIQVSGTAHRPVRIVAMPGAEVVVRSACWFLYDTSDLILSGISFVDAPFGALSVIGSCSRNRFEDLMFVNCGGRRETACTLYIGGAGGGCNVVENCSFLRPSGGAAAATDASIGLMIAQGDTAHGSPIVNCLVRRNRFENYAYGVVVGGDESRSARCGHIVEYNELSGCFREGILVKSGDTRIRANLVEKSTGGALSLRSELDGSVEDNRIVECGRGVFVHGTGHSVAGNCIVRCAGGALQVGGVSEDDHGTTENCFIENNTFIDCSSPYRDGESTVAGILFDRGTTGIIQRNLIVGTGKPYALVQSTVDGCERGASGETRFVIKDNYAAGGCLTQDGVGEMSVSFDNAQAGDYSNTSGVGAAGWVLKPQGFDPDCDTYGDQEAYREASVLEDDAGNLILPGGDDDCMGSLFGRFFNDAASDAPAVDDGDSAALLRDDEE